MSIDDDILGLDVKVDLRQLEAAMLRVRLAGLELAPALRAARGDLRRDLRDHARAEDGPSSGWPQLSPWTIAKRNARHGFGRKGGDKGYQGRRRRAHKPGPLTIKGRRLLGRLPGLLDVTADNRRLLARSKVPWSSAQRDGGVVGRGSRLPARDWLWASDRLLRKIADRLLEHVAKAWRAR